MDLAPCDPGLVSGQCSQHHLGTGWKCRTLAQRGLLNRNPRFNYPPGNSVLCSLVCLRSSDLEPLRPAFPQAPQLTKLLSHRTEPPFSPFLPVSHPLDFQDVADLPKVTSIWTASKNPPKCPGLAGRTPPVFRAALPELRPEAAQRWPHASQGSPHPDLRLRPEDGAFSPGLPRPP